MKFKQVLMFCCLTLVVVLSQEEPPSDEKVPERLVQYLKRFGYFKKTEEDDMISLSDAIKSMQSFGNIQVTGEVDKKTLALLDKPRCGMADLEEEDTRAKRYSTSKKKWQMNNLEYWIYSYPLQTEDMSDDDVNEVFEVAFAKWSAVVPLNFTKNETKHQIKIAFTNRTHPEDNTPFDGPGGVLGHAYYPESGKVHFDNEEIWVKTTPKSEMGKYLLYVATHEIGHSLGLKHSEVDAAVMGPYYSGYNPSFELHADDINGINSLYG